MTKKKTVLDELGLTKDEWFFYEHAGYVYDPKKETQEEARMRVARELARAERHAEEKGWECEWEEDDCIGCDCGNENGECPCCNRVRGHSKVALLYGKCGECGVRRLLGSLGSICGASKENRRVVEAELALDAMVDAGKRKRKGKEKGKGKGR